MFMHAFYVDNGCAVIGISTCDEYIQRGSYLSSVVSLSLLKHTESTSLVRGSL